MGKQNIYIVKFMSTGISETPREKFSRRYNTFAIIDTENGKIDDAIERFRLRLQTDMQQVNNKCTVVTKIVSTKKIITTQVLLSESIK